MEIKLQFNPVNQLLTLQNNNIDISSNGDIAIGTPTKSFVHIQKDGNIFIGPSNTKEFGYDAKKDLYLFKAQ